MPDPHISVVINAHREGLLAVPGIRSVTQAKGFAERQGLRVEVIAVLDRSDELTADVFAGETAARGLRTVSVDNGDGGISRGDGIREASGHWIAFLDADDLWGEDWLAAAFRAAAADERMVVWHPEANLYFGGDSYIFRHLDMESPEFDPLALMINNHWTALCFTRRATVIDIPYPATQLDWGIGFEDWAWNQEVIARGGIHKVVAGTAHAIRVRDQSVVRRTAAAGSIPAPTEMYRNILRERWRLVCARSGQA